MKSFRSVKEATDVDMGFKVYVKNANLSFDEIKITKLMSFLSTMSMFGTFENYFFLTN